MFSLIVGVLDIFLNIIGALSVCLVLWAFLGFQKSTLFTKQAKFWGYTFTVNSTRGKELMFTIKK